MTEYVNIGPEGTLSVCVCVCLCLSVCLSVEALAPKRLDGFQCHSGFEVGQRFASAVFFDFWKTHLGDVTAAIL